MYSLKWPNALERRIRAECARFGEVLPADLVSPPVLRLGLALYLNAWHELHQERGIIFTPKGAPTEDRISRRQCYDYAIFFGFDYVQAEDLWYYISTMEAAYFENRPKKASS